jgi:peptide/nickel transport system permease protein
MQNIISGIKQWSFSGKTSLAILFLYLGVAVGAPWLTLHPHDVSSGDPLLPPQRDHFFGTDELGVDLWSQICYGARVSILIGITTALLAALGGGILGLVAGYLGGWVDKLFMRFIDILIILPDLPLIIVIAAFLGPSLFNIILVLALFSWVFPARIVRSQVLMLKEYDYIKSAETYGATSWYLIRKHFFPEVFPLLAVSMIRLTSRAIIAEAGLSFLGLGDPTSKSWGLILYHAINFQGIFYTDFWKWWVVFPWLAISMMVSALAFVSRELEQIIDPRLRISGKNLT